MTLVMPDSAPAPMHATIRRAAAGDDGAWRRLVALHGPAVYGMCVRLGDEPDDAYQEIWEKVFTALPGFDVHGAASARTWIRTIARRHLIDRHRRRVVRAGIHAPLPPDAPEPRSREVGIEEGLHLRREARRLDQALRRLPAAQRRAVHLHHVEGVALCDLAAEEGVAIGTLKSRLHRGRARLAELLSGGS